MPVVGSVTMLRSRFLITRLYENSCMPGLPSDKRKSFSLRILLREGDPVGNSDTTALFHATRSCANLNQSNWDT